MAVATASTVALHIKSGSQTFLFINRKQLIFTARYAIIGSNVRKFRRTTLITIFCLCVLAGLGLSRRFVIEPQPWWLIFLPSLLLLRRKNLAAFFLVVLLGTSLGLARGSVYMTKVTELKALSGQSVVIEATATADAIYAQGSQLEFTANHVVLQPDNKPLAGSFRVSGFGEPMVYRGDRLQISGKLYPIRGSNQARISYAQLKRTGPDNSWINSFTRRLGAGMQTALPEPNSSFGLGLLIGQRNTLPDELTQQLVMVGLVHIVAVSGYNLTILVRAATRLRLGSKFQQLLLSLSLISVFILMTGFSASIVRAAIVSSLGLWAWYYGRRARPILILAFTAALTAIINPFYIWGDLGWYLSFLAFFGVLVVSPLVTSRLFKKQPKLIISVAFETLAAEIMTLPLIVAMFGQLSLVGLVSNVLVVPLIPLAMLVSTVAAAAGMWLAPIAGWLAWPANILLTYILDIVRLFSSIPSIFLHKSISLASMLYVYGLVLLVIAVAHKRREQSKHLLPKITP